MIPTATHQIHTIRAKRNAKDCAAMPPRPLETVEWCAITYSPCLHHLIAACRCQYPPIRAKGDTIHFTQIGLERMQQVAIRGTPNTRHPIPRSRGQKVAITAIGNTIHPTLDRNAQPLDRRERLNRQCGVFCCRTSGHLAQVEASVVGIEQLPTTAH